MKENIAEALLAIGAVELSPQQPFTWSSGIKSPIYCDNRLTMSYPELRNKIADGLVTLINAHYDQPTVIVGTATAGIPHAAWVAERMNLPMAYVRSKAKSHGKQNQIEGVIAAQDRAVVVEDLISTGESALRVAEAVRQAGAEVLGVVAIFSYELKQAQRAFQEAGISYISLSDYPTLLKVARQKGVLTEEELCKLKGWNPEIPVSNETL
ncbi:Orotate phosphoribosyltransferase [Caldalkalibacillus thermarum TA2.A1]|uniref:Orotate phosphoribosyltransferase n=1 Tax=Caldalkalibacillus thermarum (strain TA2.A1) TaxID=986075 RepID=F5L6E2_CALTT|nr:orotate phosphoribosyltransferase [Caldalkalibacillus thermarum]EGL83095.1 Orotate phosphoribosyltransferase [Caldalkalibacillus thermarum TA2.A1]QZT32783.1 orotate phosphoribosyltransferase [Caldalkalibacillus thermarum TA2.A1]